MDLLSSIRKSGSRGGVNFSWDSVTTSQHRENYLGHSLMAPVGRWQKGRDLNWYAKADDENTKDGETVEEKKARERKEEMRRIKEAEEDALAKALGLPVKDRTGSGGVVSGANNTALGLGKGELRRVIGEVEEGDQEIEEVGRGRGFGGFVGKAEVEGETMVGLEGVEEKGGIIGGKKERSGSKERRHRRHRHRSRSGERHRHRSRSGERHRHRRRHDERDEDKRDGGERRERRYRSRSPDRRHSERDERAPRREDHGRERPRRERREEPRRDEGGERRRDSFHKDTPRTNEPRTEESRRDNFRRDDRHRRRSRSPDFR